VASCGPLIEGRMSRLRDQLERVPDMHIHTEKSPCADDGYDVNDVVERALQRGITTVAITDHYHGPRDSKMLDEGREQVEEARKTFAGRAQVLMGAEVDILSVDGDLSIDVEVARTLDIVLVGFHHVLPGGECMPEGKPLGFEKRDEVAEMDNGHAGRGSGGDVCAIRAARRSGSQCLALSATGELPQHARLRDDQSE